MQSNFGKRCVSSAVYVWSEGREEEKSSNQDAIWWDCVLFKIEKLEWNFGKSERFGNNSNCRVFGCVVEREGHSPSHIHFTLQKPSKIQKISLTKFNNFLHFQSLNFPISNLLSYILFKHTYFVLNKSAIN